jgi:preprotein translocase subunit SecB
MAETESSAASPGGAQPTFRVLAQFLKDLSFENPGLAQMAQGDDERAQVKVDVNVQVNKLADTVFESVLEINTAAKTSKGILYNVEVSFGGIFRLEGIPEAAIQPALFINAPTLLYPFLRRIVADLTRDGGYPPLLLDPIDFAGLYAQNRGKINATVN